MFDIDHAIHAWCRSIHTGWFDRHGRAAELTDHLYCEIARLQQEGLSDSAAFSRAIERMGNIEVLRREHAKNLGPMSPLTKYAKEHAINSLYNWRNTLEPKKAAMLTILASFVFAIAIVTSDIFLEGSPYNETVKYTLIAVWFIPFSFFSITGWKGCAAAHK